MTTGRSTLRTIVARGAVALAVAGALAIGGAGGALWVEHDRSLDLPAPTGTYAVGRAAAVWTDSSRDDPLAPAPAAKRQLVVWAWYPADPAAGAKAAPYYPAAWRTAFASHAGVLRSRFLVRNPAMVRAHALDAPPAVPSGTTFPVVILRAGMGAYALDYTTIAEDLASHGAVVIGADAPYSTVAVPMPDGRVIERTAAGNTGEAEAPGPERDARLEQLLGVWTADTRFLLDQLGRGGAATLQPSLAGRVALDRVAVIGHGFGGATALQFCHDDARCRAGVDLDGAPFGSVVREGLTPPFLFLVADREGAWKGAGCVVCDHIVSAATKVHGDHRIVTLNNADQFTFSDQSVTRSRLATRVLGALRGGGPAASPDATAGLMLVTKHLRDFLGPILAGPPGGG
ncbi:MAG TPA: hypothetical protein VG916_09075 [Gemmatimonadaceae bacterium]|nr:hypothetical protein [Gemmatimonadaceae bacterium]